MPSRNKKVTDLKWAFFSYGHNLGDFSRALETAIGMKKSGAQVKFFNHGGVHNHYISLAGIDFCIKVRDTLHASRDTNLRLNRLLLGECPAGQIIRKGDLNGQRLF